MDDRVEEKTSPKGKSVEYDEMASGDGRPPESGNGQIDLFGMGIILLKHKMLILGMVICSAIASVAITLQMQNVYRSEATIMPRSEGDSGTRSGALSALGGLGDLAGSMLGMGGGATLGKFDILLNSRIIARRVITENRELYYSTLGGEVWDSNAKKLRDGVSEPTVQDIQKGFRKRMSTRMDIKKGSLEIRFEHTDPTFAKMMVESYLRELSELMREKTLADSVGNQKYLLRQIESTQDVLLREKLYALLAREIEKETFTRVHEPYGFQIFDPPIVSDLDKKIKPIRSYICVLSVIAAFFVSVFLCFVVEHFQNMRDRGGAARNELLKRHLRFRSG